MQSKGCLKGTALPCGCLRHWGLQKELLFSPVLTTCGCVQCKVL